MSNVLAWLPANGWQRLLVDAGWQSTLIAGVGWLAARHLTRQSAARAWLLLLTLGACALVPLASMAARDAGWTVVAKSDEHPQPNRIRDAENMIPAQDVTEPKLTSRKRTTEDDRADPAIRAVTTPIADADISPRQAPAANE
ncbi:MAG TPA: hypothetical protein VGH32_03495, partial [Pirellulales bacterium]